MASGCAGRGSGLSQEIILPRVVLTKILCHSLHHSPEPSLQKVMWEQFLFLYLQHQFMINLTRMPHPSHSSLTFFFNLNLLHTGISLRNSLIWPTPFAVVAAHKSTKRPLGRSERRKSSNKMAKHGYLMAGTLTFSSSYLMVGFIRCQTNVRSTVLRAQSLWLQSQLYLRLPFFSQPTPLHSHLDCEEWDICNTAAVSQSVR